MSSCRPTKGVKKLAPEKKPETIRLSMARLRQKIEEKAEPTLRTKKRERFAPGGQSTQMIIGADQTSDDGILHTSARLYGSYHLRRVYYSAFSPIPDSSSSLPLQKPPLMREHRLYQADWLMRFYGFAQGEILDGKADGMLDLDIDPKLAWALRNRGVFPVDVNRADREALLRVPGLGTKAVDASCRRGAIAGCGWRMSAGSASRSPRCGHSSSPKAGRPAGSTDRPACARRSCSPASSCRCFDHAAGTTRPFDLTRSG